MTRYPDLFVLRHGETEWNREGIFQGVHDSPLTATGREQAAHQGKILDRVISDWSAVDIYSSPQGRAKMTAKIPHPMNTAKTGERKLNEATPDAEHFATK